LTGQSTSPSITAAAGRDALSLPWRPVRLAPLRGTRLLKRWRYVGVFCEQLMACAASVQIGPARQTFWSLHLRDGSGLRERTHTLFGRDAVSLGDGTLRVQDAGVALELSLREGAPIWARGLHEGGKVWTRKQAGVAARGTLALDGEPPRPIDALSVIDDTAGYHAHHTEWWWSAGVGSGPGGVALAWNLVSGVNDPASGSERTLWRDGQPAEVGPVSFASDLETIAFADGSRLSFTPEAERAHEQNLVLVRSSYRAPFGRFAGTLEGGLELVEGLGVMERHEAWW
jgi:hypothetical protein